MESIQPKVTEVELVVTRQVKKKFCGLEDCDASHYARGYCARHYRLVKRYGYPKVTHFDVPDYPPCSFEGCRNKSITKTGRTLCQGHVNQLNRTSLGYKDGTLRPLQHYMRDGYTPTGRVCKVCKEEKPLEDYYDRNQWKQDGKTCKSTKCRECYIKDASYYSKKRGYKADGSDPKGYNS